MTSFLLATLYAPIASWGEIAVGERRTSWDRPSRSALLGLVGAALGIDREDQTAHDALDTGYGVAVRVDAPGRSIIDYHSAQTLAQPEIKRARPHTRRALIRHGERRHRLETILSWREMRVDAAYTVAIWAREDARWPLAALAEAMRTPAFTLYAGRKAHPLGWPLQPAIVEAATIAAALAMRVAPTETVPTRSGRPASVSCDQDVAVPHGLIAPRIETRRDAAAHRGRWQFAERRVLTGQMPEPVQ